MTRLRFHSLWSINGPLEAEHGKRQLEQLRAAGFDGAVFHPRFFPNQPPYLSAPFLSAVSELVLHARSLGLAFWIYDENGWPSGTAGGEMLERHPELIQRWAGLVRKKPRECLAEFEQGGRRWYLAEHRGPGVDYLNAGLAPRFLELTYERYRQGLSAEAFEHVEAFFCDEPELGLGHAHALLPPDGAIPWTDGMAALYEARYHEPLLPQIRDLFFTTAQSATVRVRFWELLRDRFCAGFLEPMNAWCRGHGKRFTAHIKGEEHPLFQVPMVGSCSSVFRSIGLPGIDALERDPGNDFYPRQLVSTARQFGDGRSMVEAFGGAGWGATPADLERYLLWLGGHGITDFVMHLAQYRLDSASIRDWPPSQPFHLNWAEAYPALLGRVRKKLAEAPARRADMLVISPHRALMERFEPRELMATNIHNAASYPRSPAGRINRTFLKGIAALQASGAAWDVTDEATFEAKAKRVRGKIQLGACSYSKVLRADELSRVKAGSNVAPFDFAQGLREAFKRFGAKPRSGPAQLWHRQPVTWRLTESPPNALLLETKSEKGGWFSTSIPPIPAGAAARLLFVDSIIDLKVDGVERVVPNAFGDADRGLTSSALGTTRSTRSGLRVRFRCAGRPQAPFVWLEGQFRVLSRRPWTGAATRGPFRLAASISGEPSSRDLLAAGFPFLRHPLSVQAQWKIKHPVTRLRLAGIAADAARVWIDRIDCGWIWGPDWELPQAISPGRHEIRLQLIPSTFNTFGPHHYYLGDRHVISPDQFAGKKNFADPANAPDRTLTPIWHFVPFKLPAAILTSDR